MAGVGAVDIGGTGCRIARVTRGPGGGIRIGEVRRLGRIVRRSDLAAQVTDLLGPVDALGISVPGFVDRAAGSVRDCRAAPWVEGEPGLRDRMQELLGIPIGVVHDGEAHLLAHRDRGEHPMVCVALGSAVGLAVSDDRGGVRRPRAESSWDIGMIRLATRAANPELWWALGTPGLEEVVRRDGPTDGLVRYALRLAQALHTLAVVFQPRTIVLTGGIVEGYGASVVGTADRELRATWAGPGKVPVVVQSPYPASSGLVGAALAVRNDSWD